MFCRFGDRDPGAGRSRRGTQPQRRPSGPSDLAVFILILARLLRLAEPANQETVAVWEAALLYSGRGDVPNVIASVPVDVTRLLVVLPIIERLTLIGPLLRTVVTDDDGPR